MAPAYEHSPRLLSSEGFLLWRGSSKTDLSKSAGAEAALRAVAGAGIAGYGGAATAALCRSAPALELHGLSSAGLDLGSEFRPMRVDSSLNSDDLAHPDDLDDSDDGGDDGNGGNSGDVGGGGGDNNGDDDDPEEAVNRDDDAT